jgi:integrase/recombinase XerD
MALCAGPAPNRRRRQRFTQPVGDPRDATGLYAAMRRYLEHRAMIGSTEQGLYGTERYLGDFISWAHERAVT